MIHYKGWVLTGLQLEIFDQITNYITGIFMSSVKIHLFPNDKSI